MTARVLRWVYVLSPPIAVGAWLLSEPWWSVVYLPIGALIGLTAGWWSRKLQAGDEPPHPTTTGT